MEIIDIAERREQIFLDERRKYLDLMTHVARYDGHMCAYCGSRSTYVKDVKLRVSEFMAKKYFAIEIGCEECGKIDIPSLGERELLWVAMCIG